MVSDGGKHYTQQDPTDIQKRMVTRKITELRKAHKNFLLLNKKRKQVPTYYKLNKSNY